jgi:hypothetical protein
VPVWPRFFRPQDAEAKRNPRGRAPADGSLLIFFLVFKFSLLDAASVFVRPDLFEKTARFGIPSGARNLSLVSGSWLLATT